MVAVTLAYNHESETIRLLLSPMILHAPVALHSKPLCLGARHSHAQVFQSPSLHIDCYISSGFGLSPGLFDKLGQLGFGD